MEQQDLISGDLKMTATVYALLKETARWARFLAVTGFVIVGFMIIAAVILPEMLSTVRYRELEDSIQQNFTATGIRINLIILALLLFFPCMFLFRFALKMQEALVNSRQESFEESFQSLKSTFKFYGILTIVILAIYGLAIIVLLATLVLQGH